VPTATAETLAETTEKDPVVMFSGRIRASLRKKVRISAAMQDKDVTDVLKEALAEYLAITPDLRQRAESAAVGMDKAVPEVVRDAIEEYLERHEGHT
jgi:hypothetical protein